MFPTVPSFDFFSECTTHKENAEKCRQSEGKVKCLSARLAETFFRPAESEQDREPLTVSGGGDAAGGGEAAEGGGEAAEGVGEGEGGKRGVEGGGAAAKEQR
ncbi:hypothetical protein OZD67_02670 [Wolbachia endosymbiont of Drosophila nikananu]|nr:hypothetical protein [Wolbachia endosymbiont of Drosophila nikananu]MDE5061023.1 hypothetical protein [Wolbachia endosymbiont of Drosophila nikananu]